MKAEAGIRREILGRELRSPGSNVDGPRKIEESLSRSTIRPAGKGSDDRVKGGKRVSNSGRPRIDVVETAQDGTGGDVSLA